MSPSIHQLAVLDRVPFGQSEYEYFALRLSRPDWPDWHPGQFIMLRPQTFGLRHLWGRPFSICHLAKNHLVCFFKVQGPGTELMGTLNSGNMVTVWGPLGNFFEVEKDTSTLLLAGGVGIAPFVGYVHTHPAPWNVSMLFGSRDPLECFPIDSINQRIDVESMRDEKPGDMEKFIQRMEERIGICSRENGLILACGPGAFLKTVQHLGLKHNVRVQLSVENKMACGIGACLGCVSSTTDAYPANIADWPVRVCKDGPIFWANQIKL